MYQEALLAHHHSPHNRREMLDASASAVHRNPVCGDDIRMYVRVDADYLTDISFTGRACSIATATASMMTDALRGLSRSQAYALMRSVERMLTSDGSTDLPRELVPLRSVAGFPGRHGCVLMPWRALEDALEQTSRHR